MTRCDMRIKIVIKLRLMKMGLLIWKCWQQSSLASMMQLSRKHSSRSWLPIMKRVLSSQWTTLRRWRKAQISPCTAIWCKFLVNAISILLHRKSAMPACQRIKLVVRLVLVRCWCARGAGFPACFVVAVRNRGGGLALKIWLALPVLAVRQMMRLAILVIIRQWRNGAMILNAACWISEAGSRCLAAMRHGLAIPAVLRHRGKRLKQW